MISILFEGLKRHCAIKYDVKDHKMAQKFIQIVFNSHGWTILHEHRYGSVEIRIIWLSEGPDLIVRSNIKLDIMKFQINLE